MAPFTVPATTAIKIKKKRDLAAYWIITRPGNVFITALTVGVAGVMANRHWHEVSFNLILAALSAALVAAGGNAYNDYCDRELDRLQKPHRPLPAGRLTPRAALILAEICFVDGVLLAALINLKCLVIASLAVLGLIFYSRTGKRQLLIGNVTVALIAALAFLFGGAAVRGITTSLWAAWLAFLFHVGREIIKTMEDRTGDAAANARTVAVVLGLPASRRLASLVFLVLIFSLPLPYYLGNYTIPYLGVVLGGVLPVLLGVILLLHRSLEPKRLGTLSRILKWDMVVGLAALYLGRP